MMKGRRKRGIALVYVTIALATVLAIFFRYSMNARARKVTVAEQYKLSSIEDSVKRSMSIGINEGYVIDQMIVRKQDFNSKYFNVGDYKDYFILKDQNYNNFADGSNLINEDGTALLYPDSTPRRTPVKIWEVGKSKDTNIGTTSSSTNIWKKVKKKNLGGKLSTRYPGYYAGGVNSFSYGSFTDSVRFSKGGYFISTIQILDPNAPQYCGTQPGDGLIYRADYSKFRQDDTEVDNICYVTDFASGTAVNSVTKADIDPIQSYLTANPTGAKKFILEVRKDMAYTVGTGASEKIVAAFEGIAQFEINYPSGATKSGDPATVKMIDYEINNIGP